MTAYIGGSNTEGRKLKATSGWNSGGNGTDQYGFSALPGGNGYSGGSFDVVGFSGLWWSANEYNSNNAYGRYMGYGYDASQTGTTTTTSSLTCGLCVASRTKA